MFRRILRSLFGGGASPAATPSANTSPAAAASRDLVPGTPAYKAAQKRVVAAILQLRAVVKTGSAQEIGAAIDAFKAKATADDLEPRELAGEVAKAAHMLTVLAYTDRLNRGEGVQSMAVMSDGEPAYFRAAIANRETVRGDNYGQLDVGEKGIFYDGDKRLTVIWPKVLTIGVDRESLIIHPARGGQPQTFYLSSEREAQLAHVVASMIFKQQTATPAAATRRKRPAPALVTPPDEPALAPLDVGSAGACNFNVVGESHYQGRLRNISASGRSFTAVLMPEPTNAVDPNAIRVVAEGADTVAYLSKEDAVHYGPVFDLVAQHKRVGTCQARITGGAGEKRSFGVLLSLRDADELLIFLGQTLQSGTAAAEDIQPF